VATQRVRKDAIDFKLGQQNKADILCALHAWDRASSLHLKPGDTPGNLRKRDRVESDKMLFSPDQLRSSQLRSVTSTSSANDDHVHVRMGLLLRVQVVQYHYI